MTRGAKLTRIIFTELVVNGHMQALSAAGVVYIVAVNLRMNVGGLFVALTYFLFESIYVFDRYLHKERDKRFDNLRRAHLAIYGDKLRLVVIANLIVAVLGLYFLSNLTMVAVAVGTAAFGYLYPIYAKDLTRRIYLFKNFYVSAFFAFLTYFPFIHLNTRPSGIAILLALYIFWESMQAQILLDAKDIAMDRYHSLRTLPVSLGETQTFKVLFILNSLGLVFAPIFYARGLTNMFLLVLLGVLLNYAFLLYRRNLGKSVYIYASTKFFAFAAIAAVLQFFVV